MSSSLYDKEKLAKGCINLVGQCVCGLTVKACGAFLLEMMVHTGVEQHAR